MSENIALIDTVRTEFPDIQAIYLFGSWGTEYYQQSHSDIDIAVLLPPATTKSVDAWEWFNLSVRIATVAGTACADLVNLRIAPPTLNIQIISAERRIYCTDVYAADEFEMLTLSFYQKLNQERQEIVTQGLKSGGFYHV